MILAYICEVTSYVLHLGKHIIEQVFAFWLQLQNINMSGCVYVDVYVDVYMCEKIYVCFLLQRTSCVFHLLDAPKNNFSLFFLNQ